MDLAAPEVEQPPADDRVAVPADVVETAGSETRGGAAPRA